MTERPIIFSGPMVRAILDGRKTQTRRVMKPQPNPEHWQTPIQCGWYEPMVVRRGMQEPGPPLYGFANEDEGWKCPYGAPGDRIWVRETWQQTRPKRSGERFTLRTPTQGCGDVHYAASPETYGEEPPKWRSPIHMPRWASRITLEITDVRVQRVQEISGQDCYFEGCVPDWEAFEDATYDQDGWEEPEEFIEECENECDWINYGRKPVHSNEHKQWEHNRLNYALRLAYRSLWDSLNQKRGHGWGANPWVWAITFRRVA